MDKLITMDDTTHKNLIAEQDTAQARADTLRAEINGILSKLGVSPIEGPEMRTKAILQICEESNTLGLIAEHLGLSRLDPDAVRRRVQSDAVDLKVSRERVAKVEALLAEECSRDNNTRHALSILGIIGDDLIGQAQRRLQRDADRDENSARRVKELEASRSATQTYASAEIRANEHAAKMKARVKELEAELKGLQDAIAANPNTVTSWWRSACHDRDTNLKHAKALKDEVLRLRAELDHLSSVERRNAKLTSQLDEANGRCTRLTQELDGLKLAPLPVLDLEPSEADSAELTQIWELWGAGRPQTPGCVYEAAQEMERANTKLQMKIGAATEHLDNAGIPKGYGHDQKGAAVPFEERVALLAEAYADAAWMRDKWQDGTQNAAAEIDDAHAELTALGAPRRAGDLALSLAARTRALPDLLRP